MQQPLAFLKDMRYEQLAAWLTNHPKFIGAGYQQHISKQKGIHTCQAVSCVPLY
jgi:hypothetical protein